MSGLRISTNAAKRQQNETESRKHAVGVCTRSGLSGANAEGRLVTLKELRKALLDALALARNGERDELFWGRALVAAKLTKATCNLILGSVEAVAGDKNPAIKAIKAASDFGQSQAGGTFERTKGAADVAALGLSDNGQRAMELLGKQAELINDVQAGDFDGRKAGSYLADHAAFVGEISAEYMKKGATEKVFKVVRVLNEAAFEMFAIYEEAVENEKITPGSSAAVKTVINQMLKIDAKIQDLERELEQCGDAQLQMIILGSATSIGGNKG